MKALPTISLPASCLARTPSTTPRECRFDDDKVPFRRCQNVVFTHSKLRFQVALPCNVLNSLSPCLLVSLSPQTGETCIFYRKVVTLQHEKEKVADAGGCCRGDNGDGRCGRQRLYAGLFVGT